MLGFIGFQEIVILLFLGLVCCIPVAIVLSVVFWVLKSQNGSKQPVEQNPVQEENERLKRELAELKSRNP